MRSIFFATLLAVLGTQVGAAEIMDGSGAGFDKDIASKIAKALTADTNDPYSAEIIDLHKADSNTLCGFVNLKNLSGGYTGFQPFVLLSKMDSAMLSNVAECATGTDTLGRKQRLDVCSAKVDQYVSSAGAFYATETRACLTEFRSRMVYSTWINSIKQANLPLAQEFK